MISFEEMKFFSWNRKWLKCVLFKNIVFQLGINYLEAFWTATLRVCQGNTKVYAKHMNAIFSDRFFGGVYLTGLRKWGRCEFGEIVFHTQDRFFIHGIAIWALVR